MKANRYLICTLIVLIFTGCKSCGDEIVKYVVAIASTPVVQKRIAGTNYISFARKDSKDSYTAQNGFLCVTHNPGCSWFLSSGNSGTDRFFDNNHPLPPGCKVDGVYFTQYWPKSICSSGSGGIGGWGSYGAKLDGGGSYAYGVSWNNACQSDFGDKNLYYTISFIVSMPQGTDMGESVFDVNATTNSCQPHDYIAYHPSDCATPPSHCSILKSAYYSLNLLYVQQFEGPIIYSGILSINNGCQGTLTKITNDNPYAVSLVGNGITVNLGINQSTTTADLQSLYGSADPNLPVTVSIHPSIVINPSQIASIHLAVTYSYYE